MKRLSLVFPFALFVLAVAIPARSATIQLPSAPRIFGQTTESGVQFSASGRWLIHQHRESGQTRIMLADAEGRDVATVVSPDDKLTIFFATWAHEADKVIVNAMNRANGKEVVLVFDAVTRVRKDILEDIPQVEPRYMSASHKSNFAFPLLVYRSNLSASDGPVLYQLDVNSARLIEFKADEKRMPFSMASCPAMKFALSNESGATAYWLKSGSDWRHVHTVSALAANNGSLLISCAEQENALYFLDSDAGDYLSLVAVDLGTGRVIKKDRSEHGDITNVLLNWSNGAPIAYTNEYLVPTTNILARELVRHQHSLATRYPGGFTVTSATGDKTKFLVRGLGTDGHEQIASVTLARRPVFAKLFDVRGDMTGWTLKKQQAYAIKARDGVELVTYVTTPVSKCPTQGCPMMLVVHGGPGERDTVRPDPTQQWFANAGYLVVTVNFRGSRGLGKNLELLGAGQWGLKMQDDLYDAVAWAKKTFAVDPARIGVYGASYGGYAALSAVLDEPDLFACAASVSGHTDLVTFVEERTKRIPGTRDDLFYRVGDISLSQTRADLLVRSPISKIGKLQRPVLAINIEKDGLAILEEMTEFAKQVDQQGKSDNLSFFAFRGSGHVVNSVVNEAITWQLIGHFFRQCLDHIPAQLQTISDDAFLNKQDGVGIISKHDDKSEKCQKSRR